MKPLILTLFVLGFAPLVGVAQFGETLSRKVDDKEDALGETGARSDQSQVEVDSENKDKPQTVYGTKTASTITVRVTGPAVRKPGIYHLGADISFGTLIKMAEWLRLSNGRLESPGPSTVMRSHK